MTLECKVNKSMNAVQCACSQLSGTLQRPLRTLVKATEQAGKAVVTALAHQAGSRWIISSISFPHIDNSSWPQSGINQVSCSDIVSGTWHEMLCSDVTLPRICTGKPAAAEDSIMIDLV